MYDFRKSGLYKHMKFRDIDEAILDSVKEKLLEGFRNEEEFGYMAGYEPWEKLMKQFDRFCYYLGGVKQLLDKKAAQTAGILRIICCGMYTYIRRLHSW